MWSKNASKFLKHVLFMVQCECNNEGKFLFIFQFFVSCIDASFCGGLCECSCG